MTSHLLKGLLAATLACAPALAAPAARVSWDCGTMAPFLSPPTEYALNGLGAKPACIVVSARLGDRVVTYTPSFTYRADIESAVFSLGPVAQLVKTTSGKPDAPVNLTARVRFGDGTVRTYHNSGRVSWWR